MYPFHDIAQICLNGHLVNMRSHSAPECNQSFCDKCGAQTITACPACSIPIRGPQDDDFLGFFKVPHFCIHCGQPYPWTKASIQAARELGEVMDELTDEDRAILNQSIDDLVKDTPATPVAAIRFKKIMLKLGQEGAGMFRDILVTVLSETAKKALWP